MSISIIAIMVFVSLMLGALALLALLWGIRSNQFEDYTKFLDGTKFDDEDALNDAYLLELRRKDALKKRSVSKKDTD